jgi:translocation and assembly module TamA
MRRGLIAALLLGWMASARGFDYRVEVVAPEAVAKLLETQLDVARWSKSDAGVVTDEAGLRQVVARTPAQVAELLETEGYYAARADAALLGDGEGSEGADGGWKVRVEVTPGEPILVANIDMRFDGDIALGEHADEPRLQTLREAWKFPAGRVFRHADWEAAKRATLAALIARAYPAARIASSRAEVDPEARSVRLAATFDSGPYTTAGEIEVRGLKRYPESLVRRLSPLKPGDVHDQAKLSAYQKDLQALPYFESSRVSMQGAGARAPVIVAVVEKRARDVSFGIGYSSDTGARGKVEYRDRNLNGRGLRMEHKLKIEQLTQSLDSSLDLPQDARGYRYGLALELENSEIEGLESRTGGLTLKRSREVGRFERVETLSYQAERQKAGTAPVEHVQALTPGIGWTWRAVDRVEDPTRGLLFSLQLSGAVEQVLSDQTFLRGHVKATRFIAASERGQLIVRGELGAVWAESSQGIPSTLLFRTGGSTSVRGYDFESLGVVANGAVTGGRYLMVGSAEWVQWFRPTWGGALFVDVGDAADEPGELEPALGYGLGARWRSPVGRLGLDLAWGERDEQLRAHFAVGFVF